MRDFPAPNVPRSVRLIEVATVESKQPNAAVRSVSCKPTHVLVLSGGARNGAYSAGVLKGWTESGTRPRFDVVTGVSAGGLIALFAFLGGEYDAALERSYTTIQAGDIYRRRPLAALPWAESLADSEPLRRRIETEVTNEVVAKVAHAYDAGRRLYVGTTNLDTTQSVVWDLGAIAAGNDPGKLELIRKILLASCSVPGFLPPVPIDVAIDGKHYTELHVDGGVSASLFLHPYMLGVGPATSPAADCSAGTVSVIVAGKLYPDRVPVRRRLFPVSENSLRGMFQSQMEGDLLRIYLLTLYAGMKFGVTGVPRDFAADTHSMAFDPKLMRHLFEVGRRFGRAGDSWQELPPGIDARERQTARRGVTFSTLVSPPGAGASTIRPGGSADVGSRLRAWFRQRQWEMLQSSVEPLANGQFPAEPRP
ncbi:MAG: patatin-like phospholipase family protein [Gemmataceae bacterium]